MLNEDQVSEVLAATLRVLDRAGLDQARMEVIAGMAGVTPVELTRTYASPSALLRAVIQQVVVEPMARASAELPPGKAADQLRNYAGRAWEILNTPAFARIYQMVMADLPEHPELARFFAEKVSGPVRIQLEVIISRGIRRGEFRSISPSGAARTLAGSLLTQAFWCNHSALWGVSEGGVPSRVVPETLGLLLEGLNCTESRSLSTDGRSK
jgi:AcrR family transcriptional regulator